MVKKLYILFFMAAAIKVAAQVSTENGYKLVYPEYISPNSAFDISVISSNPFTNSDKLEIYFRPSSRIIYNDLELRSAYNDINIPCRSVNINGISGNVYKAVIDLQKNNITSNSYFQLLFNFKADNASNANFKFSGIFKNENGISGYIQPLDDFNDLDDSLKFSSVQLKFYKPPKFSENALLINPGAELSIALNETNTNNLLTEFWIKVNKTQTEFLKVINKQTNSTLFSIATNPFQMVTVKEENNLGPGILNPCFLSRETWYHFTIVTSFNTEAFSVYCNNNLIAQNRISSFLKTADLKWEFANNSQKKSFLIDVLRFVDFNNAIQVSFRNKNYLNFIADSSIVLYQFNFADEDELYEARERLDISYTSPVFVKSDVPIFARAPELNISILSNSYELSWSGGDYKQAKNYILEKSVDNSDYKKVTSVEADNSIEKKYSLLDVKDLNAEVIYYRIKQVNSDGSTVYSSQVKIGQGITEPFKLEQNYPNPFNPKTNIVINILEDSDVDITVYNLEGKEITKLYKGFLASGTHKFAFDATDLPSGIYLYKVSTPTYSDTKKMILTK
jgi:Secretion system C-terminal sorting domain